LYTSSGTKLALLELSSLLPKSLQFKGSKVELNCFFFNPLLNGSGVAFFKTDVEFTQRSNCGMILSIASARSSSL
jgi:hypothetical protein